MLMSDDSDLLQVSVISFDSAVEVTELSEFESLAISPTEQEIYAAPTATFFRRHHTYRTRLSSLDSTSSTLCAGISSQLHEVPFFYATRDYCLQVLV